MRNVNILTKRRDQSDPGIRFDWDCLIFKSNNVFVKIKCIKKKTASVERKTCSISGYFNSGEIELKVFCWFCQRHFTDQRERETKAVERNPAANNTSRAELRFELDYSDRNRTALQIRDLSIQNFHEKNCKSHKECA